MRAADVKQGDRVLYAIGEVEYNAVALGIPTVGIHGGHKRASFHLNLIYLNEQGTAVKIMGAPLLGRAESESDKVLFAEMNARLHHRSYSAEKVAAELEQAERNPRAIGWRPYAEHEDAAALQAEVDRLRGELADREQVILYLNRIVSHLGSVPPAPEIETKQYTDGTIATGVAPLPECSPEQQETGPSELPSAADLDAAALQAEVDRLRGELADREQVILNLNQIVSHLGSAPRAPEIETKQYTDGTIATGVAPLPECSPEQQETGPSELPSAADLDAEATEQATAEQTSANA